MKWPRRVTYYLVLGAALVLAVWLALDTKGCKARQSVKPILEEAKQHQAEARKEVAKAGVIQDGMAKRGASIVQAAESVLAQAQLAPAEALEVITLAELSLAQEADRVLYEARVQLAMQAYELALDDKDKALVILQNEADRPKLTLGRAVLLVVAGALIVLLI